MKKLNSEKSLVTRVMQFFIFVVVVFVIFILIGMNLWGGGLYLACPFVLLIIVPIFGVITLLVYKLNLKKKEYKKGKKFFYRLIPETAVIILFCVLIVYGQLVINHPLKGCWYCEETGQMIQIHSYIDEGGNHMWVQYQMDVYSSYKYDIFSKEIIITGFDDATGSSFKLKLKAEVIDGKLHFNFIESSDGKVRLDDMVLTKIGEVTCPLGYPNN